MVVLSKLLSPDLLGGHLPFFAVDNTIVCEDSYMDLQLGLGNIV